MIPSPTEAEAFQIFLTKEVANGGKFKSPEELVAQWRRAQQDLVQSAAELQAAIDEMDRGDSGVPLDKAVALIRERHGWTDRA